MGLADFAKSPKSKSMSLAQGNAKLDVHKECKIDSTDNTPVKRDEKFLHCAKNYCEQNGGKVLLFSGSDGKEGVCKFSHNVFETNKNSPLDSYYSFKSLMLGNRVKNLYLQLILESLATTQVTIPAVPREAPEGERPPQQGAGAR